MSYSPSTLMGLPLIDFDTESNTWGQLVNNYITSRLEQGVHGVATVAITGSDVTLNDANYTGTEGHKKLLVFTGIQTANVNVIAPAKQRVYVVKNNCTAGSFTVTLKTFAQVGGVVFAEGEAGVVYCDGTSILSVFGDMDYQAKSAILTGIVAQTPTDGGILVGDGSGWVTETGDTLRTSIGAPPATRTISTTAPLSGGGDLSANRTLALEDSGVGLQTSVALPVISVTAKGLVSALSGFKFKFGSFTSDATILTSREVDTVTRQSTGRFTVTFSSPNFTSATSYIVVFGIEAPNAAARPRVTTGTQTASGFQISVDSAASAQPFDPVACHFLCIGT